MDDVPMAREATEQISHALDQRVVLRMDENLGDQILAGILDQAFTCVQIVRDISVAVDCEKCVHWLFRVSCRITRRIITCSASRSILSALRCKARSPCIVYTLPVYKMDKI